MSAHQPLLAGEINPPEDRFERLQDEMDDLRQQFAVARNEIKRDAVVALLGLLTSAMREMASGKYDLASIQTAAQTPATNSRWDAIKQRNPGRISEAIDVLLVHGAMNTSQLAAAMKMDRSNCGANVVPKLSKMGLLVRNGRMFSLKEL